MNSRRQHAALGKQHRQRGLRTVVRRPRCTKNIDRDPRRLVSVALCAATLAFPGVARADSTVLTAAVTPPAGSSTASAVAGYVRSIDGGAYPPETYDSADQNSGSVTVTAISTGSYHVDFADLGNIATKAVVQVTTLESLADCSVADWASTSAGAGDLIAVVDCYGPLTGVATDTDFDLLVTHPTHHVDGTFDYSFVYLPTQSGTLGSYQYNSSHKKNSVRFLGTGRYQVTLGGPRTSGTHGIVKVTAFGSGPGDCKPANWTGSAKGEIVDVNCFGLSGVRQDREFIVTYATANSLMGINGQVVANAFADSQGGVYQPAEQYDSTRGARVTVVRYSAGWYEVLPAGSSGNTDLWGDAQVSAVGRSAAHCTVEDWSQEYTPSIDVECIDRHGNVFNSPFTIEWVVP